MYLESKIRRQKEMLLGIIFGSLLFAQQSQTPFMYLCLYLIFCVRMLTLQNGMYLCILQQ